MLRKIITLTLIATCAIACSKETKDSIDQNLPPKTIDPFDLEEGKAEYAATGSVSLFASHATSTWQHSGFNGNYSIKMLDIRDSINDIVILLVLYSRDTASLSEDNVSLGEYPIRLYSTSETNSRTDNIARILIYDNQIGIDPWGASELTEGSLKIMSTDDQILTGEFSATAVGNISGSKKHYYNLRGSFKAMKN